MRTEYGARFRDTAERGQATERAVAASERDIVADAYAAFRRRARGEEPRPPNRRQGDRE